MPTPETFEVEIRSTAKLTPTVMSFELERVDGRPALFEPGQWVNMILPAPTGEIRRAYSIASAPNGTPRFELAVTEVIGGPGSGYLCGLDAGARLRAVGPQGFFTRDASDARPALLVGTGTGVTPLRSMMQAAVASDTKTSIWLLFGVRREADILYREELTALVGAHPGIRVEYTLSQGDPTWTGRRGYVQEHVRDLFTELARASGGEPHLFVCGLERMVAAVRQLVRKDMGIARERVHSERYD